MNERRRGGEEERRRGGEEERRRGGEVMSFGLFGWVWQGASSGCVWLVFGGIRLHKVEGLGEG